MPVYFPPPPVNPLSRLLAALAAGAVLLLAFFFGLVVLALVIGLALLAWLALVVRAWWLGRRSSPGEDGGAAGKGRASGGQVLDGDYEVISRREQDEDRH